MQFQVPQFIEIEDKIFGPLTIKQFIYIIGGAGLSFIVYTFLPKIISIPLIIIVIGFSVALAFLKINNQPFIYIIQAAFIYFTSNKLYLWKKTEKKKEIKINKIESKEVIRAPKLSEKKLKDLVWSLDIKDKLNS